MDTKPFPSSKSDLCKQMTELDNAEIYYITHFEKNIQSWVITRRAFTDETPHHWIDEFYNTHGKQISTPPQQKN